MAEPAIARGADPAALADHAASWLCDLACASDGRFALALSGGSTPKRLFDVLAAAPFRDRMPWDRVHVFWGDERLVPIDDAQSNQGMARDALLRHVAIPPGNIHWVPVSGSPADDARAYEQDLQTYYGDTALDMERPLFDVVLLGLGENGHTASLFPDTPSLEERLAWVTPVTQAVPQPRITLTYPAIACSRHVAFLVSGAGKSAVLHRVLAGDRQEPAARVTTIGQMHWFVDDAAWGTK